MGWGTGFNTEIYLNRQSYDNSLQVEDKLKDIQAEIGLIEKRLIALIAMTHTPAEDENTCDVASFIIVEFEDLMQWYRDLIIQMYNLGLYLDYLTNEEEEKI